MMNPAWGFSCHLSLSTNVVYKVGVILQRIYRLKNKNIVGDLQSPPIGLNSPQWNNYAFAYRRFLFRTRFDDKKTAKRKLDYRTTFSVNVLKRFRTKLGRDKPIFCLRCKCWLQKWPKTVLQELRTTAVVLRSDKLFLILSQLRCVSTAFAVKFYKWH